MVRTISLLVIVLFFLLPISCKDNDQSGQTPDSGMNKRDSVYISKVINHLRTNFDDIHDVSMRFHHQDHTLNGLMLFHMKWEDGKMQSAEILENETESQEFATAIIEKIQSWYIKDIEEEFEMNLPLRIRIVGSNDSTFSLKSIFTGKVYDQNELPIESAKIEFIDPLMDKDLIAACYTNREGIFVRTLIPVGVCNVKCSCKGFKDKLLINKTFKPATHHRYKFILIAHNNEE